MTTGHKSEHHKAVSKSKNKSSGKSARRGDTGRPLHEFIELAYNDVVASINYWAEFFVPKIPSLDEEEFGAAGNDSLGMSLPIWAEESWVNAGKAFFSEAAMTSAKVEEKGKEALLRAYIPLLLESLDGGDRTKENIHSREGGSRSPDSFLLLNGIWSVAHMLARGDFLRANRIIEFHRSLGNGDFAKAFLHSGRRKNPPEKIEKLRAGEARLRIQSALATLKTHLEGRYDKSRAIEIFTSPKVIDTGLKNRYAPSSRLNISSIFLDKSRKPTS